MLDEANVDQQEALGVIGVNLLYGAFYLSEPERLISSLQENLAPGRIQVDLIKFSGPAFANIDNRLMSLQLVSQGLTDAVMFTADGEMVQPSEILHKKAILIERGSFRPVTYATNDMLEGAHRQFLKETQCSENDLLVLMEMTLENLLSEGQLNHADFLARVDILGALGRTVLISKFGEYYKLAGYLSPYTNRTIGLVMGVPSLLEIFDEKYYLNLEGGILEALGRMFKHGLKLYVYPIVDEKTGQIVTAKQVQVAPNLRSLFQYLIDNLHIVVFQTDREGRLTCVNKAWSDLTGWTREESLGRYFVDILPPDHRRTCADELTAMVMQGREWRRDDLRVLTTTGELRHVDLRLRALAGAAGELIGACGTLIDLPSHVSPESHPKSN